MEYSIAEKRRLVNRLSRIRGQVEAMQAALSVDVSCTALVQQATACRGALEGFIATVIEHQIRQHIANPRRPECGRAEAANELIRLIHAYLA